MDWKGTEVAPKAGVKLWGWSATRGPVVLTFVHGIVGKPYRFVDASSMPVNDVVAWAYVVAPGETA